MRPALTGLPPGACRHPGLSADLQSDDLRACKLEPVMRIDRTAGEIAGHMRHDDGLICRFFGLEDLCMEAVLAPRLLRPGTDGVASVNIATFVMHDRTLGE